MKIDKIRKLLLQSGDRNLTAREQKILASARQTNPELAEDEQLLQKIQQNLTNTKQESFGPWFAEKTMSRIHQLASQEKRPARLWNGFWPAYSRVIIGAAVILTLIVVFNLFTSSEPNLAKAFGITQTPIEAIMDPIAYLIWE
ncbi:MAG TPA: hypothetical protein P5268_01865 [Candidatus Marinimicrobia bacterium]|nr:hypothetical protein [Candidatus Neomarinimicrobiota bacterium]HRS50897.1 hypothetical protein [Candidatus Neomarinimicrobiota bacterium]HRU91761.1 hypothetical protein [Candidatus Neomarinimicrobiota bacterium]